MHVQYKCMKTPGASSAHKTYKDSLVLNIPSIIFFLHSVEMTSIYTRMIVGSIYPRSGWEG